MELVRDCGADAVECGQLTTYLDSGPSFGRTTGRTGKWFEPISNWRRHLNYDRISQPLNTSGPTPGAPIGRKLAWLLASTVLLATGVLGLWNGATEWADARTALQQSVTGGVFLYGVLGVAAVIGLAFRRRWSYVIALAWGAVLTYVPGAAVIGYGGPDASIGGAVAASIGAAVIAGGVVWATHVVTRSRATTRHLPPSV